MSYWAEGVVGPNFGLYFEDLKNFWAEILGSSGPTWTTYWVRYCLPGQPIGSATNGRWCLHGLWRKRSAPGLGVCAEQQATAPPYPGAPPPPPLEDAHQQSRASWAGLKPGPNGKWPGGSRRPKGNARYRALVYRLRARAREPWWAGPKSACFGRLSLDP